MAVSYDLANALGSQVTTPGGAMTTQTNPGKHPAKGSGPKQVAGPSSAQVAATVLPEASHKPSPQEARRVPQGAKQPPQPRPRKFSATNPMMSVQPPPMPHPGAPPPYPDARSQQPTMMPNGQMLMPMPKGFPLGSSGLIHVPRATAQGMTGLIKQGPY